MRVWQGGLSDRIWAGTTASKHDVTADVEMIVSDRLVAVQAELDALKAERDTLRAELDDWQHSTLVGRWRDYFIAGGRLGWEEWLLRYKARASVNQ